MTTTQARPVVTSSVDKSKMDDRKRSLAADADDLAPSRKRLIKDESGQAMRMDAEKEKDVETFQKDAILRQMKEYKRQARAWEDQYSELAGKCKYHNEHLRAIDAWFAQLLDEVRVLAAQALPTPPPSATSTAGEEIYGSALVFENNELFSEHLQARSAHIKSAIADLFGRVPSASPDVDDLRRRLSEALAREKEHVIELRTAVDEQESLTHRLEEASYRYIKAERAVDRAKSMQVLKLERQAVMGGGGGGGDASSPTTSKKGGPSVKKEHSEVNGEAENGLASAAAEAIRKEALAALEKQKAQVHEVEAENERLTNELSAARTKLASLSDDDYAETNLFKGIKSQYEEVVKRANELEAANTQLREEAQKLQSERTSYRRQVDEDNREQINETEVQIARAETDLARIRNIRDELNAELAIRKTSEENRRTSADRARELAEARDSRITSLESEIERFKLRLGESAPPESNLDDLDNEALKSRLRTVEQQHELLSNELSSMEAAWRKTSALANKRVQEFAHLEETLSRLNAEKAKAHQKFFAAMRAKDLQESELVALKSQNARSSEIVSQLKDADGKTRELVSNLERQLAESKENLTKLEMQHKMLDQKAKEAHFVVDGLKKQVGELRTLVSGKDRDVLAANKARREAEVELEKCHTRLDDTKRQYDLLRKTRAADNSASSDDWRKLAICPVCNANIRNTALKLCGHVFCQSCVKDLITNRSRKCPNCARAFGNSDYMGIILT